ncbi:MAG: ribose-5-phosphate isomerase RpiA [Candidatus Eisenbacteria bacterium]
MSGPDPRRDAARDRVAAAALELVADGMAIGLGTGDTARRFIAALGVRARERSLTLTCVATSEATAAQARAAGLVIRPLPEVDRLDVAFDGADEVDPQLDLVKGGGGAQTRERIVAASAASFVVLVDEGKLVPVLGVGFPVAVEVVPEAVRLAARRLAALGAVPSRRPATAGGEAPFVTDLGHWIVDARFPRIDDPATLSAALDAIPGVVGHGLFAGLATLVLVGELATPEVRRLPRAPHLRSFPQGVTP